MKPMNYSLELEQRALETLMHFGTCENIRAQKALLLLSTECFYNHDNAILFTMIRDCFNKKEPFNFVDVLVLIPKDNQNLYNTLQWIIDNYGKYHASEATFENDIDRLILLNQLRKQMSAAESMIENVKSCPHPVEAQQIFLDKINEIAAITHLQKKSGVSNVHLAEMFYEDQIKSGVKLPTTNKQLNLALNGGIESKSLIIVAAGAGVGKTGFSIYLLDCIARNQPDKQNLFFSIEMEAKHIWFRHVGICAGKKFDDLSSEECYQAINKSLEIPIQIYDTTMTSAVADIDFICNTSRLKAQEKPISVIVVDYLGLVQNQGVYERNDLKQADITSKLAQLAIELDCVVIALSQINRANATRNTDDRCPWPHDAADSSGGHRSAALWFGVDRPELYQQDICYRNQFVVKCRKNRFGTIFDMILPFNEGSFGEVDPSYFKKPYKDMRTPEEMIFSQ